MAAETLEKVRQIAHILHLPEPQTDNLAKQELFFTHQTPFYTGDLSNMDESDGTNRMYGLSALLYTMVKNQQILVCDELDSSLHYDLFTHILKTFLVSDGTNRMYGLSALLYTMVKNQQILVCDELDSSLHYDLFTHILKTFLVNSERGQLIFSTHNLLLLDEEYIRRDMVYFANKNQSGATEVYRAKDFGIPKEGSSSFPPTTSYCWMRSTSAGIWCILPTRISRVLRKSIVPRISACIRKCPS